MSVETRPVPTSLYFWPRIQNLCIEHKATIAFLWSNSSQTASGCYLLPFLSAAAALSIDSKRFSQILAELEKRQLIELDYKTGEIILLDWFRFYHPRTPSARGAVEASLNKILSARLRRKAIKAYESDTNDWKEKVKEKEKVKVKENPTPDEAISTESKNNETQNVNFNIEELIEAAITLSETTINNSSAYSQKIRDRIKKLGFTKEDIELIKKWRRLCEEKEEKDKELRRINDISLCDLANEEELKQAQAKGKEFFSAARAKRKKVDKTD